MYEEDLLCLGKLALTSLLKGEPYIEGSAVTGSNTMVLTKLGFLSVSRPEVADGSLASVMDFRTKVFKNFSPVSTLLLNS